MNAGALILAAVLSVAASKTDPIDTWVTQLDAEPLWQNGTSPLLDLPQTATTQQVAAKVFQMTGFSGHDKPYKILEIRKVHINGCLPGLYTAVLAETNYGKVVVLLQYNGGWWSRVLDVRDCR
jgi:hypothetical protein